MATTGEPTASELIDKRIAGFAEWRGEMLGLLRELILAADPHVVE